MQKIVLASHNDGKIKELTELLKPYNWELINQESLGIADIEETGLSFIENAILKARNASSYAGLPAIADDSGLVVPSLGGEPGIYSARYAGNDATSAENIDKLLHVLTNKPDDARDAYFCCSICVVQNSLDPNPLIAQGVWHGRILKQRQGTQGFGYDPIFYVNTHQCSAAELAPAIKNQISHRAHALSQLKNIL